MRGVERWGNSWTDRTAHARQQAGYSEKQKFSLSMTKLKQIHHGCGDMQAAPLFRLAEMPSWRFGPPGCRGNTRWVLQAADQFGRPVER